ncbi:8-amino-7-oxononanoate synthase [Psychrobacter aquaticus]|uniref:8-amino-7-oxononanoate synthase n=1 Tax=Psychrobacter aquaticus CMS 56 TaxID=1354303 RepID=U4T562_9GAMM|nr:8-amino-7-oxononanoate synthase [Psychrobacter aquaticus]ERL56507.1 8-amino-7-oxononanoate synthase [Psychrobacter aquaticus CMS 56]
MPAPISKRLQDALVQLKDNQQYRQLPDLEHQGRYVVNNGKTLLNIASNDYLGLSGDTALQYEFFEHMQQYPAAHLPKMSAASSRLLTGNDAQLQLLENELEHWYRLAVGEGNSATTKSALVMNSGYHANIGILPALTALPVKTLILADKLVHASIIDGIRLSQNKLCSYRRYRHNDYEHLATLLAQAEDNVERIIIITESIFSMDGDCADLQALVRLKALDSRIELYVDEAHAVGVFGDQGCGLAEETQTLTDIDYLVGTFGKAFASIGAYVLCDETVKSWLINHMRPLIFSTALPPINHAWTRFILAKMPQLQARRQHLAQVSLQLSQAISPVHRVTSGQQEAVYQSPIVPYLLGDNARTITKAEQLQAAGFYALPIRPPTVPANTSRIRLVMNASISTTDCQRLIAHL